MLWMWNLYFLKYNLFSFVLSGRGVLGSGLLGNAYYTPGQEKINHDHLSIYIYQMR